MKWLDRALVVSPYCYGLCKSEKEFHKELKRLNVPRANWPDFLLTSHANATVHFFEQRGDIGRSCIVCVGKLKNRPRSQIFGLLTHEAVHIWQAIRDSIGEKYPSSEFEAYSIQTISQRLIEAFYEK